MSSRYMLVTYYRKANGKWDEITEFKNNLKLKHIQSSKVILDFKLKTCVKNEINPEADFDSMLDFYKKLLGDRLTPHLPQDQLSP